MVCMSGYRMKGRVRIEKLMRFMRRMGVVDDDGGRLSLLGRLYLSVIAQSMDLRLATGVFDPPIVEVVRIRCSTGEGSV